MIRQIVNIGHLQYIVDLYDAYVDNILHYDEYVMIRNYEIKNGIFDDKDLYFIERNTWESYMNNDYSLIWPVNENNGGGYGYDYKQYNPYISDISLENGHDVYYIYNKYKQHSKIRCNKIRIYHPVNNKYNSLIVDINNFINNIHVHYLCQLFNEQETYAETEFIVNNERYSEYREFYFPNVYDLFGNDKKRTHNIHYFLDKMREVDLSKEEIDADAEEPVTITIQDKIKALYDNNNDELYIPLSIYSLSYRIVSSKTDPIVYNIDNEPEVRPNDIETYYKRYVSATKSIENNYITYPVNISLFPYEYKLINNKYVLNEGYGIAGTTFLTDLKFSLSTKLGFNNGTVSLVSYFKYPDIYEFVADENESAIKKAYKFYNNVRDENYQNINKVLLTTVFKDIDAVTQLTKDDKIYTQAYYKRHQPKLKVTSANVLDLYKQMKKQVIIDELEESMQTHFNFLGFRVLVASDKEFKNIVFDNNVKIDIADLDNFSFALNNIFNNWDEVYEGLYLAKVIFIDRFLGTQIVSNTVIINNYWIRYMIDSFNYRIINFDNLGELFSYTVLSKSLNKTQNIYNTYLSYNNDYLESISSYYNSNTYTYEWGEYDEENDSYTYTYINAYTYLNNTYNYSYTDMDFYFLDNVKCVINKVEETNNQPAITKTTTPKLLYRPMFYKTNDLQNLRIRRGVTQNIGINLDQYLTKVGTFKLHINGNEVKEYGRNDIYVIFRINAVGLNSTSGIYDILNQDDEYISSGYWTLY